MNVGRQDAPWAITNESVRDCSNQNKKKNRWKKAQFKWLQSQFESKLNLKSSCIVRNFRMQY